MIFFTRNFMDDALTRVIRTFFQTLGATLVGIGIDFWKIDWHSALGIAGLAAFISFCQSVDRSGEINKVQKQFLSQNLEETTK